VQRLGDLLGLPVVTLAGGRRVGRVRDLVLDPGGRQVLGLLLSREGWFRGAQGVPWGEVVRIGRDAVLVRGEPRPAPAGLLWSSLRGKPVLTLGGAEVGLLADLEVDPGGRVQGYRLSGGVLDDLLVGQARVEGPAHMEPGSDVVLLSGPAAWGEGPGDPGQEGEHALS